MIYANLYGVTSAAYVLLTTLVQCHYLSLGKFVNLRLQVLADLLGAEAFTNAFGLLLLFQVSRSTEVNGYMFINCRASPHSSDLRSLVTQNNHGHCLCFLFHLTFPSVQVQCLTPTALMTSAS